MPNPENIESHKFKKGQTGNPNGRPKGSRSLTTILREYMDKELEINDPITKKLVNKRIGDIVNLKLIANAIKGDQQAIKMVFERLDGMPTQKVDVSAVVTEMPTITRGGKEIEFDIGTSESSEAPGFTSETSDDN